MKACKVAFLVFLCVVSLCAVAIPVKSQVTGDTVYILSDGSVYSALNVTVPIQRDGEVYTFTDNLAVVSFLVQRGGITIDGAGYALRGEGDVGIDLTYVGGVTVQNVQLEGTFTYGIYIAGTYSNTITGNTIKNNGNGIGIYNCSENTITNNIITDNSIGIEVILAPGNEFRNNNLDNFYNLAIHGTELSHYVNDMDDSNTIGDNKKVYYLVDENNLIINPNTFPDAGFIALVNCNNITVQNIEVSNNIQGIILAGTTEVTISQSSITGNQVGVMIFSASNNYVTGNFISNNERGIQLSMFSNVNSISANNITANKGGLAIYNSSQNTISGNSIVNNNNYGLVVSASSFNLIRGNYFINNGINAVDRSDSDSTVAPSVNSWYVSYPAGGNYWSDYTGIDVKSGSDQDEAGNDGIGDTPYVINTNNQDNYPLILEDALYVYITSPENKTYNVNSVTLTYTVSESDSVVGYSLDGQANITISQSTTLSDLAEGSHKLTVYAKDAQDNENSHTVYFTIAEEAEPPQTTGDEEELPITLIAVVIAVVAVVGVAVVYFLKIKK